MSAEENTDDKLRALPNMNEEHLETLKKHGLTTPEKLLEALKDAPRWKAIHAELKGVGPKTVDRWKSVLESGETAVAAPKPPAQVVRVARQVKKPAEAKKEPEPPKPEIPVKKAEPEKPVEKPAPEKPKVREKSEVTVKEEKKAEPEKASAKGKPAKEKPAKEKKEEEVEVVEEGAHVPNKKPKLSKEMIDALKKRKKIAETRPEFTRQEYGRRLRLRTGWRKPRGIHSKTRMKMRYRRPMVSIGYAGPRLSKGLHPSGFREVHVFNVADLSKISDADQQAARISHGVGQRKRELIIKKADELGIRVLNRR